MRGRAWRVIFLSTSALLLAGVQAQEPSDRATTGAGLERRRGGMVQPQPGLAADAGQLDARARAAEQCGPFLAPDHIASFGYLRLAGRAGGPSPARLRRGRSRRKHLVRTRLRWYAGSATASAGRPHLRCLHTAKSPLKGATCASTAPRHGDLQSFVEAIDRALVATRDDRKFDARARRAGSGRHAANRGLCARLPGWSRQQQLRRMNAQPDPLRPGAARRLRSHLQQGGRPQPGAQSGRQSRQRPGQLPLPVECAAARSRAVERFGGEPAAAPGRAGSTSAPSPQCRRGGRRVRRRRGRGRADRQSAQFRSSINVDNLAVAEERYLRTLLPPAWPQELSPIDGPAAFAALFCSRSNAPAVTSRWPATTSRRRSARR